MVEKYGSLTDWKTACGTGPYLLVDYVSDSSSTLQKNPDYYGYDPRFPENKLPYADTIKALYIPDQATRLAALRTGKLDEQSSVSWEQAADLIKTAPLLRYLKAPGAARHVFTLRPDKAPFDNIKVRQAMNMALDRPSIIRDYFKGNADMITLPMGANIPGFSFSLDELPPDCRILYEYNPQKAKQLLTEAGYPNGFKTSCYVSVYLGYKDEALIIKQYLAAINIDLELILAPDSATYWTRVAKRDFQTTYHAYGGGLNPYSVFSGYYQAGAQTQYFWGNDSPKYVDPYFDQARLKAISTTDPEQLRQITRDLALYCMAKAYTIDFPLPVTYTFWQPWLKAYEGETWGWGGEQNYIYAWVDQDLKKTMVGH
jgi:peptide/nickel transport system substrate-binding protein